MIRMKTWTIAAAVVTVIAASLILIASMKSTKTEKEDLSREKEAQSGSLRLNTASLESGRVCPDINNIPRGKNYNILLYFLESFPVKYLNLKVKGKAVVPNWHRLARNALVARNHYANFPLTANALLSVLTSAYDPVFKTPFPPGVRKNSETLRLVVKHYPDMPLKTMSEILKARGYRNLYVHTWRLSYVGTRRFLQNRKFDTLIDINQLRRAPSYNIKLGYGVDDRAMIEPGIQELKRDRSKPFFAVFCPMSPHFPYPIPDLKYNLTGPVKHAPKTMPYYRQKYINSLHYGDAVLGMLMDRLEAEGLLDNTLVFIVADHGQAFWEHRGNFRHRTGIYEENVHVPFMIYSKKFFKNTVYYDGVTRHIDILPTVQDVLGIKARPEQEGLSLLSPRPEQMALFQTYGPNHVMGVRDGRWKYLYDFDRRVPELYDLSTDPDEKKNLAEAKPELAKRYQARLVESYYHRINYYKTVMKTNREL